MPKMLDDFTSIREALYADLPADRKSPQLIAAWENREGIDSEDWDETLKQVVLNCAQNSPGLTVALVADPTDLRAFAMLCFIMGWELQKKKAFEEQFDAAS